MTLFFPTLLAQSTGSISCVSGNLLTPVFFAGLRDARVDQASSINSISTRVFKVPTILDDKYAIQCKYCQDTKEDTLSYVTYSRVQSYYYYYLWDVNDIPRLRHATTMALPGREPWAAWPGLLSEYLDLGIRDQIMRMRSSKARMGPEGDDSEDEFSDSTSSEDSQSRGRHYGERYQLSPEV
ncbi:hypothetical protein BDP27DRAFT_1326315 [Rhodocollybia butyracea]|uniref:Uncharacterized protein n=1 Tax=Rhodocollybia butyracea TaxID=206335 RepID=A0A9P5U7I3_9AGAR|nr:hypothetical protein BDP27DRAFT_1326315 [Rhodocollybia butyracea]